MQPEQEKNMFFSVIVPFHDRAESIPRCIESILSQTDQGFELLMVDDHSNREAIEVVQSYQKENSRVRMILSDGIGAQAARNTGIRNAKYDWIMFNDSDDEWFPDKIKLYREYLEKENFDVQCVLYSDYVRYSEKSGESVIITCPYISETEPYEDVLLRGGVLFSTLCCSKKHLFEIGLLDEKVEAHQEWETSIRLARKGLFICVKEPTFKYYYETGKSTFDNPYKSSKGRQYIIEKYRMDRLHIFIQNLNPYLNNIKDRKIALWGYGNVGKLFYEGLRSKYTNIEIFDKKEEGCRDPAMLRNGNKEYFVVVSVFNYTRVIKQILIEYGYCEIFDFICLDDFHQIHQIVDPVV